MGWTKEQQKVISLRNKTILVSAAAGSGKTAVLVERILSLITNPDNPVDIDSLLIVTFTNAAASEMRERIRAAIDQKVEENPQNIHLQKQQTLIHTAPITTIDSFCLRVIKEHFDVLDLDPSFRIGDEGEKKLIKADVVGKLLEDYYQEGKEKFFGFIESYSTGKSDAIIEDLIFKLYEFSMSYPNPEEWLFSCLKQYDVSTMEELGQTPAMKFLMEYLLRVTRDGMERIHKAMELCREAEGPHMYLTALQSDYDYLETLSRQTSYELFGHKIKTMEFVRLSSKKDPAVSEDKRNQVKWIRDSIKSDIKDIKKQFYFQSSEQMLADIQAFGKGIHMLIELTREFMIRYEAKKNEKNLLDFHDVEHLALRILTKEEENGERKPSEIADEYSNEFYEIMIDEYQDSNLVQEAILTSVSKERFGISNIFMVGDVKQSIYKFRLARPELFMEKYDQYPAEDSEQNKTQRIDLHKNFRSRSEVLESINDLFYQLMDRSLGNITYNSEAALYPGAIFEQKEENIKIENIEIENKTELWLIEKKAEDSSRAEDYTAVELEAKVIAQRIRDLTNPETGMLVWDKLQKKYRKAKYQDIVILLRTVSNWADTFLAVFAEEKIPAYADSQTGYFTAIEVQTILNLLKIIDNPCQDIPFTGILRSPIVGLSSGDLAEIKICCPDGMIYEGTVRYTENGRNRELKEKLTLFLTQLNEFREMVPYTPIHEFISFLLKKTGYGDFAYAMPAGLKRKMNLDMLLEKAALFETTSYRGLFQFIRYIEKLQKFDVDFGEASILGENDNTVRLMSIHKSKGLEFPIVIVAGMGKKFNQQDAADKVIIHPDLGLAGDYVNYERRTKSPVLIKRILQKSIRLENLGEELRVLYVALTRAKEKLIMTGTIKGAEERLKKWIGQKKKEYPLAYSTRSGAACYLDWVIPAHNPTTVTLIKSNPAEVIENEKLRQTMEYRKRELLELWEQDQIYNEQVKTELERRFAFQYPFLQDNTIHAKTSVSELKHRYQKQEQTEDETSLVLLPQEEAVIPEFLKEEKESTGTYVGTAYHTLLQYLFTSSMTVSWDFIKMRKDELVLDNKLTREEANRISNKKILHFLESPIAERMRIAFENQALSLEKQFVMGLPANEIYSTSSEEIIIIQGIIDVYFEEEDGLVLLDYKTDYIKEGEEEILIQRYYTQFNYYRKALSQMLDKPVKETYLYSFSLEKTIPVF